MALTGLFFSLDSYAPIFEELSKAEGSNGRDGSEQRLQFEGNLWRWALEAWLTDDKEALQSNSKKQRNAKRGKQSKVQLLLLRYVPRDLEDPKGRRSRSVTQLWMMIWRSGCG